MTEGKEKVEGMKKGEVFCSSLREKRNLGEGLRIRIKGSSKIEEIDFQVAR